MERDSVLASSCVSIVCVALLASCVTPASSGDAAIDAAAIDAAAVDAVAPGLDGALADARTADAEPDPDSGTTGARLLYHQGFEADGWESEFTGRSTWAGSVAVVTHEPRSGARSLRGNQLAGVVDPITGLPGRGNPLLDWRGGGDIAARTPHQMYFSYWFRHDDYQYTGSGEGKLLYFVDGNGCGIQEMYFGGQLIQRGLAIAYDNGCGSNLWAHCASSYHGAEVCDPCRADGTCDNWGYSTLWLEHPEVEPGVGIWRHFEYFIDYDDRYFQVWIDGQIVTDEERYPDGRIAYGPERTFHWQGFQLFYASTGDGRDLAGCVEGEGTCGSWQIDDLEVWDGLPAR